MEYCISDKFRLHRQAGMLIFKDHLDRSILELPETKMLAVARNQFEDTLKNNHYHGVVQQTEEMIDGCEITHISACDGGVEITGKIGTAPVQLPFTMKAEDQDGLVLSAAVLEAEKYNRLFFRMAARPKEHFYGFGEQFTHFDLTGHTFPLITGEQGVGRSPLAAGLKGDRISPALGDDYSTYAPMAITVTSDNRAILVDNDCIVYVDAAKKDPGLLEFQLWDTKATLRVWQGDSLLDAVSLHTAYTGRYQPLPQWAHGVIVGMRGGKEKVEAVLKQCREERIPVSAIWIEDWVGRRGVDGGPPLWWRWNPNEAVYPDFQNWVQQLKKQGIRVLTYFNTFLSDDLTNPYYLEAREKGYLVKNKEGEPYQRKTGRGYTYYMVDLTNPQAYQWLKNVMIDSIRRYDVAGWMADYGEYMIFDAQLYDGETGVEYHQKYAEDWVRLNREVAEESGRMGDLLIFNRGGFGKVNRYSLCFWEGDQNVTFDQYDGLASSVVGLLSGGISGIALNHSDLGGHTSMYNDMWDLRRSKELLWRWAELSAFTPVYRPHDGSMQDCNHQFYDDAQSTRFFGLMGRLHQMLYPLFAQLEEEAAEKGYPVIRHTLMHDTLAANEDLRYQYMLGADVAFFPVWQEGASQVEGYIPSGRWIDPWNGTVYEGGKKVMLSAPLGKPAVLLRKDSLWEKRLMPAFRDFMDQERETYRLLPEKL